MNDASEANELLVGNIPSIRISREFVTAYVRINRALFKALQGESTSAGEFASLASSAAEKLDRTLGRTPEVATFEEECQAQSSTLLAGGMDEGSAREIRTLSGVWALKYQRFITPH
ncbi:hypothetical protein [Streptomyces sp. NPDC006341]|uniref:hypothetical protein n=1 Tax=Streptomyces sp. NPDC006341 TaxID=3156756 RepID=UPI0033B27702